MICSNGSATSSSLISKSDVFCLRLDQVAIETWFQIESQMRELTVRSLLGNQSQRAKIAQRRNPDYLKKTRIQFQSTISKLDLVVRAQNA
jgi:hypothetical protein